MRFWGVEASSVILCQMKYIEIFNFDALIMPKQIEAIRDGVINPQNTILINLKHGKFW